MTSVNDHQNIRLLDDTVRLGLTDSETGVEMEIYIESAAHIMHAIGQKVYAEEVNVEQFVLSDGDTGKVMTFDRMDLGVIGAVVTYFFRALMFPEEVRRQMAAEIEAVKLDALYEFLDAQGLL